MDRTSFAERKRRLQTHYSEGLEDLLSINEPHPQRTPPEAVGRIRELALEHPANGCTRHEAMLGPEARNAEKAIEMTSEQAAFLKKLTPCFQERHVE